MYPDFRAIFVSVKCNSFNLSNVQKCFLNFVVYVNADKHIFILVHRNTGLIYNGKTKFEDPDTNSHRYALN